MPTSIILDKEDSLCRPPNFTVNSPIFRCLKPGCGHKTSGIILDDDRHRHCPVCRSFLSEHCLASVTREGEKIICDQCNMELTTEHLIVEIKVCPYGETGKDKTS